MPVDPAALRETLETVNNVLSHSTGVIVNKKSPIFAAAREFLRLMETAETVWWCEVHRVADGDRNLFSPPTKEVVACFVGVLDVVDFDCRMVEAVLTVRRET